MRLAALRGARRFSSAAASPLRATLFPGDGVGPEIADAVSLVLRTAGVPVEWDEQRVNTDKPDPRTNSFITRENLDSVKARAQSRRSGPGAPCFRSRTPRVASARTPCFPPRAAHASAGGTRRRTASG